MNRWNVLKMGALIAVLAALVLTVRQVFFRGSGTQVQCKDCNILLVVIDPLRADALSAYGNPRNTTPSLDALAKKGYVFTRAYSVAPWTLPAAMSLMTGTYPSTHGVLNKELIPKDPKAEFIPARLSQTAPGITTLAQNLKSLGYVTGGFAGGAALSASYGFDKGFDEYASGDAFDGLPSVLPKAMEFIRKHRKEKMFLFIHGFDVHGQYIPPGGLDRRYVSDSYRGDLTGSTEEQKSLREEGVKNGKIFLTGEDVSFLRSIYDEKAARLDMSVQKIISEIESLQLSEKTIVIFTSNHGEEFYEHGRIDHGMTLFDEVLRIPLIMVIPGTAGNKQIPTQVSNIDIIPTIFSLIGKTPDPQFGNQLRGISLVPAFSGKDFRQNVFAETSYRYATFQKAVRTYDQWKLITDDESQVKQLYDINKDPKELEDIFSGSNPKASELIDALYTHRSSLQQTKNPEQ